MKSPLRERFAEMICTRQDIICEALAQLDRCAFREQKWQRDGGGGGRTRLLERGEVFDKAGVNVSLVHGTLPHEALQAMRNDHRQLNLSETTQFCAAGISLVLHPKNPMVPTVHANYRYFELGEPDRVETWWMGGGADLTPCYLFDQDVRHFHRTLKESCDRFDRRYYPRFKHWCDQYFHNPHRSEQRGVGGIFFDDLTGDPEHLLAFATACADAFLPSYLPILTKRHRLPFTPAHKEWQELRRGRYVEFNLVYDRGTRFGLMTGGRTESILMSLPLVARWQQQDPPHPGSEEAKLLDALRTPRAWL